MKTSAPASAEVENFFTIKKLALEGEGLHLEFKRKAAHPEKIVRELIAFANTAGGTLLIGVDDGTLLIGVDDDGSIPGVKYPDEEIHVVTEALNKYCRPLLVYQESVLSISDTRSVVRYDISPSEKIHFLIINNQRETFVRVQDMSIKASAEMQEIIKRSKKKRDIRFVFGDAEKKLMVYIEQNQQITLTQYMKFSGLNRFRASRKLILLVLANVMKVTASERGDLYSRV